jgi:hypothetical protein
MSIAARLNRLEATTSPPEHPTCGDCGYPLERPIPGRWWDRQLGDDLITFGTIDVPGNPPDMPRVPAICSTCGFPLPTFTLGIERPAIR